MDSLGGKGFLGRDTIVVLVRWVVFFLFLVQQRPFVVVHTLLILWSCTVYILSLSEWGLPGKREEPFLPESSAVERHHLFDAVHQLTSPAKFL